MMELPSKWAFLNNPIICISILLLLGTACNTTNGYSALKKKKPSIQITLPALPDKNLCLQTDTGWSCKIGVTQTGHFNFEKDEQFKKECTRLKGQYRCYGMCLPSYPRYCDLLFSDAGQSCKTSNDCQGHCIMEYKDVLSRFSTSNRHSIGDDVKCKNCIGKCANYALRLCDKWFEIDNQMIRNHTTTLCD